MEEYETKHNVTLNRTWSTISTNGTPSSVQSESVESETSSVRQRQIKSKGNHGHIYTRHNFFLDEKRKVDYVLVANILKDSEELSKLSTFMYNLLVQGLQYEIIRGKKFENLVFIKLHCPIHVIQHTANIENVIFDCQNPRDMPMVETEWFRWKICNNITTIPDYSHPDYHRAICSLSHTKTEGVVSWERSYITERILEKTKFGPHSRDKGVKKLCSVKVLEDAYPTHDGPWEWRDTGPLNDRQLLSKYWASMYCIFKNQPIRLIYKYYGPEVAFYFAFLDYYNKMLIIPSIVGIISFLYSAIHSRYVDLARVTGVCDSTAAMCPLCYDEDECEFTPIANYCYAVRYNVMFDNIIEIACAIFVTVWATVFIGLWERREFVYKFHWDLLNSEYDISERTDFVHKARATKISPASGERVQYMTSQLKCEKYTLTVLIIILMIAIIIICQTFIVYMRVYSIRWIIRYQNQDLIIYRDVILLVISGIVSVLITNFLTPYFFKISRFLTNEENPRAMLDFYNRCIYKFYILSFFCNYVPSFYMAMFKGIFYTYPSDMSNYEYLGWRTDVCSPMGCAFGLSIFLMTIVCWKLYVFNIIRAIKWLCIYKRRKRTEKEDSMLPAWERDYSLHDGGELYMVEEFMDLVIQYGIVIFFIATLPLVPFFALISNVIQVRMDARRMLRTDRRPLAKILPGIGSWNSLLRLVTFVGAITNAMVIAFTSDLIDMEVYRYSHDTLDGFFENTLSEFNVKDYPAKFAKLVKKNESIAICMYRGRRNAEAEEDETYMFNEEHWKVSVFKLLFVLLFQQIIWIITAICSKVISPIPDYVLQELNEEAAKVRENRFEEIASKFGAHSDFRVDDFKVE